ncbi:fimbrial protein [Yersinia alsatica]|uniref:fimbrial protein n=1 Tax=Yersinia alsatica TaxID=2890317 RepID=UPI0011A648D7|nr:fimbrial protein [Yersinia alsatica]
MKLLMKRINQVIGGLLLAVTSFSSWAVFNCVSEPGFPRTDTVQLSPANISAGADIPVGTVIYQGRWVGSTGGAMYMGCVAPVDSTMWFNNVLMIDSAPLPLSSWTGSPFGGAVYQTNIPGIGIAISFSNDAGAATQSQPYYQYPADRESAFVIISPQKYTLSLLDRTLYVTLIKTGTIAPGNYTLNASSLPKASISTTNPLFHPANTGLPVKIFNIQFQGQLNISTRTCTTPDVNVYLGKYEKSQYFTGINSATPWIDSSIKLTNCPVFYGFYNAANSTLMLDNNTGQGSVVTSTNNSIGVRLTPVTEVIDSARGIIGLDSSIPGAASGVGIQIGWGSVSPSLFDLSQEKSLVLPKDGSTTVNVPLSARYIQTSGTVTPGNANAKVVFLINYY